MAITDKEQGVWDVDEVYNKINEGGIWKYTQLKTLWAIGRNQFGQAGQNVGHAVFYSSPTQIGTDSTWGPISNWNVLNGGGNQFGSLKTDGTLWAWGQQNNGQFGLNNRTQYSSPTQVGTESTWDTMIMSYQGGGMKTDGTHWMWGGNDNGELGLNDAIQRSSPCQIPGDWSTSAGNNGIGLGLLGRIKTDGTLWVSGGGANGQLGNNESGPGTEYSSPVQIPGTTWNSIAVGYSVLATKTDGTLWSWGDNGYGQLGENSRTQRSSPVQIGTGTTWSNTDMGDNNSYAITTNGELWGMGRNYRGELGVGDQVARSSPVQVPGTTWKRIAAGQTQFCGAVKTDGTLWAWGYNHDGQLGQNEKDNEIHSPVQIPGTSWDDVNVNYFAILATQLA